MTTITFDVECFKNYLLVLMRNPISGHVLFYERYNEIERGVTLNQLRGMLTNNLIVGFNSLRYDILIIEALFAGYDNKSLKLISDQIINDKLQPWVVRSTFKFKALECDHIDLINVAPLQAKLKLYGARMNTHTIEELPVPHDCEVNDEQAKRLFNYCITDNVVTGELLDHLKSQIALRVKMSSEYGIDLRSKSDAQIAEAVFKKEHKRITGVAAKKVKIEDGCEFFYRPPDYIKFKSEQLNQLVSDYQTTPLVCGASGHLSIDFNHEESRSIEDYDKYVAELKIDKPNKKPVLYKTWCDRKIQRTKTINHDGGDYAFGIGGLHSILESKSYYSTKNKRIVDIDAKSFYPFIILFNKYKPSGLRDSFQEIYAPLVERRMMAVVDIREKDARSLKIIINGAFGKLSEKHSCLYSPDVNAQITITGQLTLMMIVEMLSDVGIKTLAANTDGVTLELPVDMSDVFDNVVAEWEVCSGHKMSLTEYESIHFRDVNNYIALLKTDKKYTKSNNDKDLDIKSIGCYADPASKRLSLNPKSSASVMAMKNYMRGVCEIDEYINECDDILEFANVATASKGAKFRDARIGTILRFYYGKHSIDCAVHATSGNKIANTDGAELMQTIPESMPDDLDRQHYIDLAISHTKDVGLFD